MLVVGWWTVGFVAGVLGALVVVLAALRRCALQCPPRRAGVVAGERRNTPAPFGTVYQRRTMR